MLAGLREIARVHGGDFRLTPNQNLIVAGVSPDERPRLEPLLAEYGLDRPPGLLRQNAIACVALPTCGLAMAESECYLPGLISKLEAVLAALTPILRRYAAERLPGELFGDFAIRVGYVREIRAGREFG